MSNDFSPIDPSESEGSMFAPIPTWERGKKRRGASRVAAEPRTFAAEPSDATRAYEARMDTVDPTDTTFDTGFASGPTFAGRTTSRKGNGAGPILVVAGVILVGGLAAAGWYATRPHNAGVAELTPGATTTTTQVASTAPAADQAVAPPAAAPAPPARTHSVITTTTRAPRGSVSHTTVTHARPAAEASADASATSPVRPTPAPAPAPTQAAPPAAATTPAPLVLNVPPAETAPTTPAPAPTQVTPQTAPATPPTQTPPN